MAFGHFDIIRVSDTRLSALCIGNKSPGIMGGGTAD